MEYREGELALGLASGLKKKGMEIHPDATLDTFGTLCPVPIYLTSKKMKELKKGEVLEVLSDDVGILSDMPAWCKMIGNEIVCSRHEEGQYRFYLRKLTD